VYGGSANFAGSSSAALAESIRTATTTTNLTSSPNPSFFGQTLNFIPTVVGEYGGSVTGTVTFKEGAKKVLGTASVVNGAATLPLSTLRVGPHTVTAVYGGDANDTGSTSAAITQTVMVPAATTTTISSSLNPSTVTQAVTFTAVVSSSSGGKPTGTVTFVIGKNTVVGTATLSGGQAKFQHQQSTGRLTGHDRGLRR
jgi:hypothetical protein